MEASTLRDWVLKAFDFPRLLRGDRVAVKEEYADALPARATKAKPETFILLYYCCVIEKWICFNFKLEQFA